MSMYWHVAYYGTWRKGDSVTRIDFGKYHFGTYDREKAFKKAQEVANETGREVTVSWDIPTGHGLRSEYRKFLPAGQS